MFLLDDSYYVLLEIVDLLELKLYVYYGFQGAVANRDQPMPNMLQDVGKFDLILRRIAYTKNGEPELRPIWKTYPIRGKIEIYHFGRQVLLDKFFSNNNNHMPVLSIATINFLDGFGLYRNMYRSLIGFYVSNAGLSLKERKRRTNLILLTIGPHRSNLADVVNIIGLLLTELDASMVISINSVETIVCVMLLFFIGNMPQQQENSRFQS